MHGDRARYCVRIDRPIGPRHRRLTTSRSNVTCASCSSRTTHPGNIGAAARAMLTMGLARLVARRARALSRSRGGRARRRRDSGARRRARRRDARRSARGVALLDRLTARPREFAGGVLPVARRGARSRSRPRARARGRAGVRHRDVGTVERRARALHGRGDDRRESRLSARSTSPRPSRSPRTRCASRRSGDDVWRRRASRRRRSDAIEGLYAHAERTFVAMRFLRSAHAAAADAAAAPAVRARGPRARGGEHPARHPRAHRPADRARAMKALRSLIALGRRARAARRRPRCRATARAAIAAPTRRARTARVRPGDDAARCRRRRRSCARPPGATSRSTAACGARSPRCCSGPGFLTREYLAGRRKRYVRPARLVLVLAIVLFARGALRRRRAGRCRSSSRDRCARGAPPTRDRHGRRRPVRQRAGRRSRAGLERPALRPGAQREPHRRAGVLGDALRGTSRRFNRSTASRRSREIVARHAALRPLRDDRDAAGVRAADAAALSRPRAPLPGAPAALCRAPGVRRAQPRVRRARRRADDRRAVPSARRCCALWASSGCSSSMHAVYGGRWSGAIAARRRRDDRLLRAVRRRGREPVLAAIASLIRAPLDVRVEPRDDVARDGVAHVVEQQVVVGAVVGAQRLVASPRRSRAARSCRRPARRGRRGRASASSAAAGRRRGASRARCPRASPRRAQA